MSKTLKKVAVVAGVVALAATGVGAFAAAGSALAATSATVASVATIVSAAASAGSALTAVKPPARGSVNQIVVASDAPQPYMIGRTYAGGVIRHDVGYGAELKKVKNPYRGIVTVYSGSGPIEEIESLRADHEEVGSYFSGFLYTDTQLGATPESSALTPHFAGMTKWTSAHKLSGYAAVLWNLLFDKDGKKFAAGVPLLGIIGKGVKCYDPRKDSTYPGGSGSHRIDDESTWEYTENPSLHGLTYAYGRYQNGKRVFGIGNEIDVILTEYFVAFANVCDTNGWKVGGVIFEPGDKWDNLKNILAAGGGEPVFANGMLSVRYDAPSVALDTITEEDLAEDTTSVPGGRPWAQRVNGIIPKFRSEAHNWEYMPTDLVSDSTYVALDGQAKNRERQWNLVQDKDQVSQLAGYDLYNARERAPIEITVKPRLRAYRPGEILTLDLPNLGLDNQDCMILTRSVDPATMKVTLTFQTETASKHAKALGFTGTDQPLPAAISTEDLDTAQDANTLPIGYDDVAAQQIAPTSMQYQANYKGELVDGQLPDTIVVQRLFAGVDVSDEATWSIYDQGGITGGTITVTDGVVTIPSGVYIPTSGGLVVRSIHNGLTKSSTIGITRLDSAAPLQSDEFVSDGTIDGVSSTTLVAVSDEMTVKTGASGVLDFSGALSIIAAKDEAGTYGARMRWQYKTGADPFADVGATNIEETATTQIVYEPDLGKYLQQQAGSINTADQQTGLSATTDYVVRLMAARDTTTPAKTINFGGTVFVQGS